MKKFMKGLSGYNNGICNDDFSGRLRRRCGNR